MPVGVSPLSFALGGGLFIATLAAHIAWWRLARPRRDMAALFAVFMIGPLALGALAAVGHERLGWRVGEIVLGLLLHTALAAAYVQTYPASQARSPTLVIIDALMGAGPAGLGRDEIAALWARGGLVDARVEDLVANGLLVADATGVYRLSPGARRMAAWFGAYRGVLGLAHKGG